MPTAKTEQDGAPVSMSDIAATLVTAAQPTETPKKVVKAKAPAQPEEDDFDIDADLADDEDFMEDQSPDGGDTDDEDEFDETVDASNNEGDEQEDEQSDEDGDETDYLDIRDDDLISVIVDGEEQEISIGDLKKAHSLGGATERRLQEATEMRKAAHAERTQLLEAFAAQEQVITTALSSFDDNLFKAVIPPPDERMKQTNPSQYLRHKEAYEHDQGRIADAKRAVEAKRKEIEAQRAERLQQYGQQAAEVVRREIPELADPKTADQTYKQLANTAAAYGYTPQEIQNAMDPRMFMLVRDAMKYRSLTAKTKETRITDLEPQQAKKVRRLRSGNTQAKTRARQGDKNRKAAMELARKTGKPKDIAATLFMPKG